MRRLVIFLVMIVAGLSVFSQENPAGTNSGDWMDMKHAWKAWWISYPSVSGYDYGLFHYRKDIQLSEQPDHFIIHISADNRYRLFVNGTAVCDGPAKGDFLHWQYETTDIAKYLKKGSNTLAAQVYNFGEYKSVSQFSRTTAFILQGDNENEFAINTDNSWKVFQNKACHPIPVDGKRVHGFYVVGPCDSIVAQDYPWGWEQPYFDDSKWVHPHNSVVDRGTGAGYMHGTERTLVKRQIPFMEEKDERFKQIVRSEQIDCQSSGFLKGNAPIVIEAHQHIKILIDNGTLNVGYPTLTFSGSKSAKLKIEYAEALFDRKGLKGNRNDISGKEISGAFDVIIADGGSNRSFRPLSLRTFRYIQLEVETNEEPLSLNDFRFTTNRYPLEEKASFSFEPEILPFKDIWNTGWRTARLCANETYWDCPYYEQLQYIGDTRIQALISLYVSGDDRLMRNALEQINNSITGEGLTLCRAPSSGQAIIPPFSLIYIGMLHDYYLHRPDSTFLKPFITNINPILTWFESRLQKNGLLGTMEGWQFTDWANGFHNGIPAGSDQGNSAILSLTYANALKDAADLYTFYKKHNEASDCIKRYNQIKTGINALCFDVKKSIYADTPEKQVFSQHANIMAVMSGIAKKEDQQKLMKIVLNDSTLIQCSMYYKFYLMRALVKSGMGDEYFNQLKTWEKLLTQGLSTFPENETKTNWEADTRSDCHGWSASVCYDYLSVICGITPASAGFKSIRIEPNPGQLKHIEGKMPHPSGFIEVSLNFNGGLATGSVILPENTKGEFIYKTQSIKLQSGTNTINL